MYFSTSQHGQHSSTIISYKLRSAGKITYDMLRKNEERWSNGKYLREKLVSTRNPLGPRSLGERIRLIDQCDC